jgi:hypothetical protein
MIRSSGIIGRTGMMLEHRSGSSNELDWSSPVPDKDSNTRLVPLTRGKFAIVDAEDFELVNQFKWFASYHPNELWYALRTTDKVYGKPMRRLILDLKDPDGFAVIISSDVREQVRAAIEEKNNANKG